MTRQGVFISHAHEDRELAEAIALLLKSSLDLDPADITCTSDAQHGLTHGESTKDDIRNRISSARALLLLLTHTSRHRDWVHYEAAVADKMPPENFRFYMMTPVDDDDALVPAPYQGVTLLRLWQGEEVLRFIRELRAHLDVPEVSPDLYIDALSAVSDRANEIRLARRQSEHQKQINAERTHYQRLKTVTWGLAAASVVLCAGMLGALWWTSVNGPSTSPSSTEKSPSSRQKMISTVTPSWPRRKPATMRSDSSRSPGRSGTVAAKSDARGSRPLFASPVRRATSAASRKRVMARGTLHSPGQNCTTMPASLSGFACMVDGQSYEHVIRLAEARLSISVER